MFKSQEKDNDLMERIWKQYIHYSYKTEMKEKNENVS